MRSKAARGAGRAPYISHVRRAVAALALLALVLAPSRLGPRATRAAAPPRYQPAQIARAYDVTPLWRNGITGRGETIAFMEVDGVDPDDVAHFDRVFGLPPVQMDLSIPADAQAPLPPGPETTMDVEWAHALAPQARLRVYEVTRSGDFSNYSSYLADAIKAAISDGATAISISLRGTGSILCSTFWASLHLHPTLQDATAHGITVFSASGDYGYRPCQSRNSVGTVYPASDPYVTAVGGTRLTLSRSGGYGSETAWSGSGGGNTHDFTRPSWQRGPGSFDPRYRSIPDVSFVADPQTGVLVYVQGQWVVEGGTSLGAPAWAALWALAAQYHRAHTHHALGWANPLLYGLANSSQYTRVFHDVTQGSNGYWHAGSGWDAVTGWGTPDAYHLVQALTP